MLPILLYLVFSDRLEGLPALLIFALMLYPIAERLGVDPVHFGIVDRRARPRLLPAPAALGLSLACSRAGSNLTDTVRVFWVYVLVLLAGLAAVALFPDITLVVLNLMPVT